MNHHKVLILTSGYGDGHQQAANAIHRAAQLYGQNVETVVMDFMEWVHPFIHPISRYVYIQGVKKFPSLYGYMYQKTRYSHPSTLLKALHQVGLRKMLGLLKEIQPTSVVSTFPLAAAAMSLLKSKGLTDLHTVTVITDHTDHSYWIHPYTDLYIVGSERVAIALNRLGIPYSHISTTGIPIRPEFMGSHDRQALKKKHGLNPYLPTVLVMGGGCGMIGDGRSSLEMIETLPSEIQLIIVCGRNQKLLKQLTEQFRFSKHHVRIIGYVDHIHEFMAASDLLITKPGGLTTSEAIASELPMLFYKPLPGQEEDNAKYLLRIGVALRAKNESDLVEKMTKILCNPELLQKMKAKTKAFHARNAACDALNAIVASRRLHPFQAGIKENSLYPPKQWKQFMGGGYYIS